MVNVDWKVCAAAIGVIIVLILMLFRLYPMLQRIDANVSRLDRSQPPPRRTKTPGREALAQAPPPAKGQADEPSLAAQAGDGGPDFDL